MSVIGGIITPIVRRIPGSVIRSPKPTVNNGSININRLYNVVVAIDIRVSDNLDNRSVILFCYNQCCYILVNVFCQNCLNNNDTCISIRGCFHNPEVINFTVIIQIKV